MQPKNLIKILLLSSCALTGCQPQNYYDPNRIVSESYVHSYGIEMPQEEWESRGESGQIVSTLDNGVICRKNYEAGKLNGSTTYTYPYSEAIARVETYSDNVLTSKAEHSSSGTMIKEVHYFPENKVKISTWFENGSPQSIEEMDSATHVTNGEYYDIHHQLTGKVIEGSGTRIYFDLYGKPQSKETIEGGGVISRTLFYPTGNIKETISLKSGVLEGEVKRFQTSGEPESIEEWKNGKKHGITILFQNGEKIAELFYNNGMKHGIERLYRDGKNLVREVTWKYDQRHGPGKTIRENNNIAMEWFYLGKPVSKESYELLTRTRE